MLLSDDEDANPEDAEVEPIDSQDCSAQSFLSMIDKIRAQVPPEEWKKLPKDLSKNIDHYLYGSQKIEE